MDEMTEKTGSGIFKLYALGSNGSGQLGLGHADDQSTPSEVPLPQSLTQIRIGKIAAGGNHTLILAEDGVRASGCGLPIDAWNLSPDGDPIASSDLFRDCGFGDFASDFRNTQDVATRIQHAVASWEGSLFVLSRMLRPSQCSKAPARLLGITVTGRSSKGELGSQSDEDSSFSHMWNANDPTTIDLSITDIAVGMNHVAAIRSDGSVWGWGNNSKGQLGKSAARTQVSPVRLHDTNSAHRVVCGKDFTCIIGSSESGSILVLGSDRHQAISNCPVSIRGYKDVAATWGSIYVLFEDGQLISWGRNDHGQLCPPDLPSIESFAAGSEHVVAVTHDGHVITWGWGEHGNCGQPIDDRGDVNGRFNSLPLPQASKTYLVGAGCATTFIAVEEEDGPARQAERAV